MADEDPRLESRVAKIESDATHFGSNVAVIQTDLRELRRETSDGFKTADDKIEALRRDTSDGFKAVHDKIEAVRRDTSDGFKAVDGKIEALRRDTSDGFKAVDGKIEALRRDTSDGFKEARKSLRTDLGLFLAGLSLLASAGLGIAALVFKT